MKLGISSYTYSALWTTLTYFPLAAARQRGTPQRRPGTGPAATALPQPGGRRVTVALTGTLLRQRPRTVRLCTFSNPFTSRRSARAA